MRDYTGLDSTSSLLVKELFSPMNVITSSLLVSKLVRLSSRPSPNIDIEKRSLLEGYKTIEIVVQLGMIRAAPKKQVKTDMTHNVKPQN